PNKRDGTLEDVGLQAEISYDPDGEALAGMGIDAGDINADGWPDFVVTNFHDEYHSVWLHTGAFPFANATHVSRVAGHTRDYVGWGVRLLDYDNDGDLDLMIANGHVNQMIERTRQDVTYAEAPLLLGNDGRGVFENLGARAGPPFEQRHVARGLATADIDNDGDLDAAFIRLRERPLLLRNTVGQDAAWIGAELRGVASNRDAIGARVVLHANGGRQVRWVLGGGGFLSSHDRRVVFGLGSGPAAESYAIEVRWPNGGFGRYEGLQAERYHILAEPSQPDAAPASP
ncbi:MAG: CRTAC1 family protein, partial [Bryobacterales bacterium]|nr:CRTAC1 family protein [Bryobacterales bacterium]